MEVFSTMAGKYEIRRIIMSEDYARLRIPELKVEGTSVQSLSRAVSKKLPQAFISNTYLGQMEKTFYEIYARIDLQNLREIDNNVEAQKKFIDSRFPPNIAAENLVDGKLIPLIFLAIDFKVGDRILDSDIQYINNILTWGPNKIYLTPILIFEDSVSYENRIEVYRDFINRLLVDKDTISSRIRPGVIIPGFYRMTKVAEILELFNGQNESPAFVALDFQRNRITSSRMIGALSEIERFFMDSEESEAKFFIYGFNPKPYKRGMESALAEDMGCFISGISAIGDNYRLNLDSKIFIPPIENVQQLPKLFNVDSYTYGRFQNNIRERFVSFYENATRSQFEERPPLAKYPRYVYKFNVFETGREANLISTMLKRGEVTELRQRIESKSITTTLKSLYQ